MGALGVSGQRCREGVTRVGHDRVVDDGASQTGDEWCQSVLRGLKAVTVSDWRT